MTPLLLVPGHMCDGRMWAGQVAALSATRSLVLAECAGADTMAGLAAAVLAAAPARFALCGLSMGGIVAMEVLRQAPGRVERLALLDTNPLAEAEAVKAQRVERMGRVAAGALAQVVMDEMKPLYLAPDSSEGAPGKGAILDLCYAMAMGLGPDVFARQSRALMDRPDQTATLAAYRGPALVATGAEDRLVPMERHALMARLMPQAELVVIEGAGHLPPLERPEATNAALARWLAA